MAGDDRKSRRKQRRDATESSSSIPSNIVCTPQALASSKNSIELGLVFALCVVGLYFYGFWQELHALPIVTTGRHLEGNLNMANLWDYEKTTSRSLPAPVAVGRAGEVTEQRRDVARIPITTPKHQGGEEGEVDSDGHLYIPEGKWPVTLQDEPDNTELLIHPGDETTEMYLPKFWSPPLHNKQQFTRDQAMRIGSCVEPDPTTGSHTRGDDCPMQARTIFIAIASYRDFECRSTVESAFKAAKHPERIRVAVVDQIVNGEDARCDEPIKPCAEDPEQALCKYKRQVDVYEMEAKLSIGPVFARHIGHRMYRGEYYSTQSDAHVTFTTGWDVDILDQMEATHNDMAVLTTYLSDIEGSIGTHGESLRHTRPIMCNTIYEGGPQGMHLRHGSQPERMSSIHGSPQLEPWWAAGYSFSRGHFVVNVPYDPYQPMIFQGEEMSIGIRGFSIGYDFYAPERSVCFHHYAVGKNAKIRNKVHHFWENNQYAGVGKMAMSRLLGIVRMNPEVDPSKWDHKEEDRYGLGGVRTPEKFYKTFGIDVVKKETQGHLCKFVSEGGGQMHVKFAPFLRDDGMGIDYSKIHFKWLDPDRAGTKEQRAKDAESSSSS